MAASAGKRDREKKLQERAERKRQRRAERATQAEVEAEGPDSDALMARFQALSEAFAAGAVNAESYEAERREIFAELGLQTD